MNKFVGSDETEVMVPRRPLTSYIRFCQAVRTEIVESFKGEPFNRVNVAAKISEKWKGLTDADRAVYDDAYKTEMAEFNKIIEGIRSEHPGTYKEIIAAVKKKRSDRKRARLERTERKTSGKKGKRGKKSGITSPSRKFNPFMVYSSMVRKQVLEDNPGIKTQDVAKTIGRMWREMSDDERKEISDKAGELAKAEVARRAEESKENSEKSKENSEEDSDNSETESKKRLSDDESTEVVKKVRKE